MWREKVYSGTLRPRSLEEHVTGSQLSYVLDKLTATVNTNPATSLSSVYSINKIAPGLYLGDKYAARDKKFLVRNGITHVVNAAEGIDELQVNTNESYYKEVKIRYLGIPGHDRPSWDISVYFEKSAKFIDNAIKSGGKVFVHCVVGISRSATLVIAYLMLSRGMNAVDALDYVFRRRRVFPNDGFLNHLAQLNSIIAIKGSQYLTKKYY